jgi:hypothetical protein
VASGNVPGATFFRGRSRLTVPAARERRRRRDTAWAMSEENVEAIALGGAWRLTVSRLRHAQTTPGPALLYRESAAVSEPSGRQTGTGVSTHWEARRHDSKEARNEG